MSGYAVQRVEVARLRPTEEVDAAHVRRIAQEMQREGVQRRPIVVEAGSLAILDGHHRFRAAQELGLSYIAAVLIGYDDPRLTLASWTERPFTPAEVLAAAASGKLFPAKSTRHILEPDIPDAPAGLAELTMLPTP